MSHLILGTKGKHHKCNVFILIIVALTLCSSCRFLNINFLLFYSLFSSYS